MIHRAQSISLFSFYPVTCPAPDSLTTRQTSNVSTPSILIATPAGHFQHITGRAFNKTSRELHPVFPIHIPGAMLLFFI
jgi:hypothetical protein